MTTTPQKTRLLQLILGWPKLRVSVIAVIDALECAHIRTVVARGFICAPAIYLRDLVVLGIKVKALSGFNHSVYTEFSEAPDRIRAQQEFAVSHSAPRCAQQPVQFSVLSEAS